MFLQILFLTVPFLIFAGGCGGKSQASPSSKSPAPSIFELNLTGGETWRADVKLNDAAVKIQRTDSQGCQEWPVIFNDKTIRHDLKSMNVAYFYPDVSPSVEVVENIAVLSFRPLTKGVTCKQDLTKNIWVRENAQKIEFMRDHPTPSVSSKYGLSTTSEIWEFPYDYVWAGGLHSMSPEIQVSNHKIVGISIYTDSLDSLKKLENEIAQTPPGWLPIASIDHVPNSDSDPIIEITDRRSSEFRKNFYDYLCDQSDVHGGKFSVSEALEIINPILEKWKFKPRPLVVGEEK